MSQLNVNVVAPLGYTGTPLIGDNNFVQVVDATGDTVLKVFSNDNTTIGKNALDSLTTGQRNIAIGTSAATNITTASDSISIGYDSLKSGNASSNIAIGKNSLKSLGAYSFNTSVGVNSLTNATLTSSSVAIGSSSGSDLTNGINNAFLGANTGAGFTSGNNNTFVGCQSASAQNLQTGDNNILIGSGNVTPSTVNVSNEITLGNSSHAVIRAAVTTITSLSDERDKKDIEELPVGLDFVQKLKPVKFVWNDRAEDGKHDVEDFGFIAQDLKAAQEESEAGYLNLVYDANPEKLEASYGKLLPVLVKAMQEMSSEIKSLKEEILTLKSK